MGEAQGYRVVREQPADWWEVEALYDTCFGPGRTALSSYRLRDGVGPVRALCLLVRDADDVLAGAIRTWPVRVGTRPCLLLGPIAVHPTRQGEGLGALLLFRCLRAARDRFWTRALLVGDLPYYGRFGFRRLAGVEMPPPTNAERVLGIELAPGGWVGVDGAAGRWTATDD